MKKFLASALMIALISAGCYNSTKLPDTPPEVKTSENTAEPPKSNTAENPVASAVEDADYYIKLAEERLKEKSPSLEVQRETLKFAQKAVQLAPESSLARCVEGKAKFNLGRFQQAQYSYSKAIELNPEYDEAYFLRGCTYICISRSNDDWYNAIEDFNHALSINPNYAKAYFRLGYCQNFLKEYDLALGATCSTLKRRCA